MVAAGGGVDNDCVDIQGLVWYGFNDCTVSSVTGKFQVDLGATHSVLSVFVGGPQNCKHFAGVVDGIYVGDFTDQASNALCPSSTFIGAEGYQQGLFKEFDCPVSGRYIQLVSNTA